MQRSTAAICLALSFLSVSGAFAQSNEIVLGRVDLQTPPTATFGQTAIFEVMNKSSRAISTRVTCVLMDGERRLLATSSAYVRNISAGQTAYGDAGFPYWLRGTQALCRVENVGD